MMSDLTIYLCIELEKFYRVESGLNEFLAGASGTGEFSEAL